MKTAAKAVLRSDLLWKRAMRLRRDEIGDAVDRPGWRSAFLGDPGAKFLCGKPRIGTKNPIHEKLTKLREHLSKSR